MCGINTNVSHIKFITLGQSWLSVFDKQAFLKASRLKNRIVDSNNNKRTYITPIASWLTLRTTNAFNTNVTIRNNI